jgi:hypothetical protein
MKQLDRRQASTTIAMQVWWNKACAVIFNNCSLHELWKIEILQLHG